MKKTSLEISLFTFLTVFLFFIACKKEKADTTGPVVSISGSNPYYIQKGTHWSDPGASASDEKDGEIIVSSSGTVNSAISGYYTVTYSARDNAGNSASQSRMVYVVDVEGDYSNVVSESPYPAGIISSYSESIHLATDGSGKATCSNFGNYANGNVYFYVTGLTTITLPAQTIICGSPSASRTFSGTGTINISSPQIIINYDETGSSTSHTQVRFAR
jgi:hypothetical protein